MLVMNSCVTGRWIESYLGIACVYCDEKYAIFHPIA